MFNKEEKKDKYNTHFGPEETPEQLAKWAEEKRNQQQFVKEQLKLQMQVSLWYPLHIHQLSVPSKSIRLIELQEKNNILKQNQQFDNKFDQLILDSNMIKIEEEKKVKKEKKDTQKEILKEHWGTQVKFANEKKANQIFD